jgi:predicted acyltransferase
VGAGAPSRLKSVDVFRGAAIVAMILVNAQFSDGDSYRELVHSPWNGWTFADTIFPAFLFIVGVSIPLASSARLARGEARLALMKHAARRALLLFALGVAIDYLRIPAHTFPYIGVQDHLQLTGVLQKIAICYLAAQSIYLAFGRRGSLVAIVGLNLVYIALLYLYPVPQCGPGVLTIHCSFPGYLDHLLLSHFQWNSAAFDPDGIGAILPAISSVLFGVLAGEIVRRQPDAPRRALHLLEAGLLLLTTGMLLSIWMPINKHLWTTSFAVFMAGLSAITLAGTVWLVDGYAPQKWYKPLDVLGRNAIVAYLLSRPIANIPRVHLAGKSLYTNVLAPMLQPHIASLAFAIVVLIIVYFLVWFADHRRWRLSF